ncbi:MAG: hypothetical protein LKI67_05225 [Olsenella sp.]|jgi:hypothetical protein|nr:hypothetical protein [Olsenella sp.]MCI1645418.1 hypothetical protein [Olsenella sp.]MCI1667837.1 hypothetical protein [Olsenella sp.]MCI1792449.1 hypothetical protein [Olsenella sp.]MCI1811240.1 hypothetical protein [Olsenella sp.]
MADSTIKKDSTKEGTANTPGTPKAPKAAKRPLGTPIWIAICVVALVVGILCGHFLLSSGSGAATGKTTMSESDLDSTIATYMYSGSSHAITAREVIEQNGSLDNQANSDGSYNVPSADDILSYARNKAVLAEAESQGVTVSDDDVSQYAQSTLGTDDYATIGSNYGLDEDATKSLLHDAAVIKKLRDSVVTTTVPDQPTAPTAPSDGNEDTTSADYAQYIINLAGDEWDSANNTWASTDGTYYSALSTYSISNDSASYAAAEQAYYVAYSNYSTAASQASREWTTYVNGLLSNASIQISSLTV